MSLFKKFRYYSRLALVFFQKQKKTVLLGAMVGILVFYFGPKFYPLLINKNTRVIGLVGSFSEQSLPLKVKRNLSDGLTRLSADGRAEPFLAEGWEVEKNGKVFKFMIKTDRQWHDGTKIKAKDINYRFSDVTTQSLDEKTILFELREPFSPFPVIVSQPVFKKGLVGTGDYLLKSITKKGETIEKIKLNPKAKNQPGLIYRFYPSEETARLGYKLGEINVLEDLSLLSGLDSWPNTTVEKNIKNDRFVAVFFNTQDPFLEDKSLRQALAYAIKKPWEARAMSPLNPGSWAFNPTVKPYQYDLVNAQSLLNKSEDEKEESDKIKQIELATTSSLLETAEAIKKDWQALGIETKIRVINTVPYDFQALLVTQEIPADPDQYVLWHSTQPTNLSRYKNPKIDKLLEDGRKEFDQEKRKEIYFDFQRFIVEETPVIFLFHPTVFTVTRN